MQREKIQLVSDSASNLHSETYNNRHLKYSEVTTHESANIFGHRSDRGHWRGHRCADARPPAPCRGPGPLTGLAGETAPRAGRPRQGRGFSLPGVSPRG